MLSHNEKSFFRMQVVGCYIDDVMKIVGIDGVVEFGEILCNDPIFINTQCGECIMMNVDIVEQGEEQDQLVRSVYTDIDVKMNAACLMFHEVSDDILEKMRRVSKGDFVEKVV